MTRVDKQLGSPRNKRGSGSLAKSTAAPTKSAKVMMVAPAKRAKMKTGVAPPKAAVAPAKTAKVKAAPKVQDSANENRNEKGTDQFVRDLLRDIGQKNPWEQDGGPKWKRVALAGASKTKDGKGEGKPLD